MNAMVVNAVRFAQSVCAASACSFLNNCIIMIMGASIILLASIIICLIIPAKNRKTVWINAASTALRSPMCRE